MKFEHTDVYNFENALRGLRHPYESYSKADSYIDENGVFILGPNDTDLAQRMIKAGSPNDKFMRQIFVSVDITAPLYWWKEMDQYKVGTTTDSQSTMHKLTSNPITIECFEIGDLNDENLPIGNYNCLKFMYNQIIDDCEDLRKKYIETKDIRYWKELIRWLPSGWLQTRTWTGSYANLRPMYHWRKNHKLVEWNQDMCGWIEGLPLADKLLTFEN